MFDACICSLYELCVQCAVCAVCLCVCRLCSVCCVCVCVCVRKLGQGGISTWRIFKTLPIPALAGSHSQQMDPPAIGKLSKSVIEWDWHAQATKNGWAIEYETWMQGWAFRNEVKLSLPMITFDHCLKCQSYRRLMNDMCHLCWNARIPMPSQFRWQLQPKAVASL